MDQIITFIFSIITFIFGFLIIFNISNNNDSEILKMNNKIEVQKFQMFINEYCKDRFKADKFSIKHYQGYNITIGENKICSKNSKGEIYCQKVICDLVKGIIFETKNLEFDYVCKLSKVGNLVNVSCGK